MRGAALLAARLRVITRQQQHQLASAAGPSAWPSSPSASSPPIPFAGAASAPAPAPAPLVQRPHHRPSSFALARATTTMMSMSSTAVSAPSAAATPSSAHHQTEEREAEAPAEASLPPGASPLLPAREASAAAAYLARAGAFAAPPAPLTFDRGVYRYPDSLQGNPFGRAVLRLTGCYSRQQTLRNGAGVLWEAVLERAGGGGAAAAGAGAAGDANLARAFGLDPRAFMTAWHLESLGVWLVVNRLKLEGAAEAADFQQHLYTHLYQPDVARRVRAAPGVVSAYSGKWLRRLEQVFYGMALAYDRAIVGGDGAGVAGAEPAGAGGAGAPAGARAALSLALVRNVYGGDGAYAPSADLLARYLCRQLQCLAMTPTEDLYLGQVRFGGVEGARAGETLRVPGAAELAEVAEAEEEGAAR